VVHLTTSTKPVREKDIARAWHHIDAKNQVLGRIATKIAEYLIGKHKANYVSHLDMGDNVVVTNILQIVVTGRKEAQKIYSRYSGYPGGLKTITFKELKKTKPTEIVRHAVYGMLPKNKLRDKRIIRLHLYKDENHPFSDKFKDSKKS